AVAPLVVAAHLPPPPADPLRSRLVFGAYADPWPGAVDISDASTGAGLVRLTRRASLGELLEPLQPGPLSRWDRGSSIEIALHMGHPADAEALDVLAGTNRLAIETDAGH